jgi:uncharacterized protein YxjI
MLLSQNTFFVKERVAFAKLTDTYDILDPSTQQTLGIAREEPPSWAKWLRLLVNKQLMPTRVNIYAGEGQPAVVSIHRGVALFHTKVTVTGSNGRQLGYFKSKLFSLGGGFFVFDHADQQVAEIKGDWKGWNFKFTGRDGQEIGTVTKKWAGIGKELFTSADNYIIVLNNGASRNEDACALLLAAGIAIDTVYKEKK